MEIFDIVSVVAAFAAVGWLIKTIFTGNDERAEEEQARAFFDEHGHWPDEDPPERSGEVEDPGAREPGGDLRVEERP